MKTIKVIDLLNKIANGEASDLTTRFIFNDKEYSFYSLNHSDYCLDEFLLNQEIEIIEENKKIEKIGIINYSENPTEAILHKKIDEIIDYLNKGDESNGR